MRCTRRAVIASIGMGAALSTRPAGAQIGTILSAPVTLVDRALEINSKAEVALAAAKDVHHLNYRLATDAFATLYVLGRALSAQERSLTLAHLRPINGVRRVVDYIEVRPRAK
jgi:hypothetical protein